MQCVNEFLQYVHEDAKKRQSAKGIIILDDEKILVLRIQTGCHAEGKWDLPGGGIEDNETAKDAFIREVNEETGLTLIPESIKSLNTAKDFDLPEDGVHAHWRYFIAKATNGNVELKPAKWNHGYPEHSEYKWVSDPREVEELDMCDENKSIVLKQLKKLSKKDEQT